MTAAPAAQASPPNPASAVAELPTPPVWRRMAAFLYEGVLLFGVLMISAYLYSSLSQMRHAMVGRAGLQAFLFVILGIYFTWFWSRGGQTVAMKAWHVRLVDQSGQPVTQARALCRYLLSWMWFAPALLSMQAFGLHGGGAITGVLLAGVLVYANLARLHPDRQFWHDAACRTRLVTWRPPAKPRNAA